MSDVALCASERDATFSPLTVTVVHCSRIATKVEDLRSVTARPRSRQRVLTVQ